MGSEVTVLNFVPSSVGKYEVEKKTTMQDVHAKLEISSDGVAVILPPTDDTDSSVLGCVH